MADSPLVLEGHLSVTAAIEAKRRQLYQILVDDNKRFDRQLSALKRSADSAGLALTFVPAATIQQHASGNTHGGVIALVGQRRFAQLGELLPAAGTAFIVMLDGIEDPYNFGFAIRALFAAGVDGAVLRQRNWTTASAVVGRASAGAVERLPLGIADSAEEAAVFFRAQDLLVAATSNSSSSKSIYAADLTAQLFLLIGGERRGVTQSFQQRADFLLRIPYSRSFKQSLGTVSAASIIAFEVSRQRQQLT